jgi:hypothetical protein
MLNIFRHSALYTYQCYAPTGGGGKRTLGICTKMSCPKWGYLPFFGARGLGHLTNLKKTVLNHSTVLQVDLHLRTKADLYSFMQCSFVKIQNLIGYVSEYMLMQLKTTYKATYAVCRLFVMIYWYWWKSIIACLCKFHSRAGIIGAQKASIAGL